MNGKEGTTIRWHALDATEVLAAFGVGERGLTHREAKARLASGGRNVLPEPKPESLPRMFLRQFASPLIYVLVAASLIILLLGDIDDALIIAFVLVFNAVVGTVQEGRAQRALLALRKFVAADAIVIRDGEEVIVPDADVVPGDILVLREGERVPADARILAADSMSVAEAAFTGENLPVQKSASPVPEGAPVADRADMVFKGTTIATGHGRAVVVATGINTVMGGIARQMALMDTEVPLKREVRALSRWIVLLVGAGSLALIVLGLLQGRSLTMMFAMAVSLAVSVIPEGLPIVMTLVLATGVWRMSKRHALVKRLQAVQALGKTDIIAVDKTGTLTRNELVVRRVHTGRRLITVGGEGYATDGALTEEGRDADRNHELVTVARIAALTATAHVVRDEDQGGYRVFGDPTEAALEVFSRKVGVADRYGERRLDEIPFNPSRRYRAVLYRGEETHFLAVAGAPEVILTRCRGDVAWAQEAFRVWASEGLRVLALASATTNLEALDTDALPQLELAGVVGMQDDLRAEVPDAVAQARAAGVQVAMITGDHLLAARSVAEQAGIAQPGDRMLTGERIDQLSDEELADAVQQVTVFARVAPEQKLRIITAWRSRGLIVAMTGDGVNDAPSLVAADLGVAMGRIGTEVAKESADIVLLDDNLSSIVAAIEEGRSIYKTIKKVILYLLSTSLGEVLTIFGALLMGWPTPLLAGQIVWLNLVTDGFLTVTLAMDPKEQHLLRPEHKAAGAHLVDNLMVKRMIFMAVPMSLGGLWVFSRYMERGDLVAGMTVTLTTLAAFQWFNAFNCRFNLRSVFRMNWLENPYLLAGIGVVVALQLMAVYAPFMQRILKTEAISATEWMMAIGVALCIIVVEELRKAYARRRRA